MSRIRSAPAQLRLATAALALALTGLLAGCGSAATTAADSPEPVQQSADAEQTPAESSDPADSAQADAAPAKSLPSTWEFSAATVAGREFQGASLADKPAVLWFWAPWCSACRAQIGPVSDLVEKYGDDVSFVGVGSLDQEAAIKGFAGDVPADMPHLLDPEGGVWRHFGVVQQSTFVVLDARGKVQDEGYIGDDELADLVSDLAG